MQPLDTPNTRQPGQLSEMLQADPDFVDRVFEYLLAEFPQIAGPKFADVKRALRDELRGEQVYVPSRSAAERQQLARQALSLFNGRNATEVARRLSVSRATVYRLLKQPHGAAL